MFELQSIYSHLSKAMDYFSLKFDPKKFNFIRFGNCDDEKIFLFDDDDNLSITEVSQSVRYLGFYISDKIGIDLDFHVSTRCNKNAREFEEKILRWCANN